LALGFGSGRDSELRKLLHPNYFNFSSSNTSEGRNEYLKPFYDYSSLVIYNAPTSFISSSKPDFSTPSSLAPLPSPHISISEDRCCIYGFILYYSIFVNINAFYFFFF
jgi:hypothetical protein